MEDTAGMRFAKFVVDLPWCLRVIIKPFVCIAFDLRLRSAIEGNYRCRAVTAIFKAHGSPSPFPDAYPDQWYWADYLCSGFGLFVEWSPARDEWITRYAHRPDKSHR